MYEDIPIIKTEIKILKDAIPTLKNEIKLLKDTIDILILKTEDLKILKEKTEDMSDIVDDIIRNLESAFPKDEENKPDYIGHRLFHRKAQKREKEDSETRAALKKNILTWASIGILTVLVSSFVQAYVTPIIGLIK